jgi:predicted nucleic acid-binding protein
MSKLVVADTSPIHYLVLCGIIDVLPHLFERVVIPVAVKNELQADETPDSVKRLISDAPSWLTVEASEPIHSIHSLDRGELEAIALAQKLHASFLLIDERVGRTAAEELNIPIIGTIGIIRIASDSGYIDLTATISKLRSTNMRLSPELLRTLFGK